jgi:hypothetical protein
MLLLNRIYDIAKHYDAESLEMSVGNWLRYAATLAQTKRSY